MKMKVSDATESMLATVCFPGISRRFQVFPSTSRRLRFYLWTTNCSKNQQRNSKRTGLKPLSAAPTGLGF